VTELLGLNANQEEHKVQWLSVAGDDRFKPLFQDILCMNNAGLRLDRGYFSTDRISRGGFGARFYDRLGLEDGKKIPEGLRAHIAAGIQRAIEEAAIRMAGPARNL
jgi:carbamoyltransferase